MPGRASKGAFETSGVTNGKELFGVGPPAIAANAELTVEP